MLTLPIKKKWFDMILSGEKKEEYRATTRYYTKRFQTIGLLDENGNPTGRFAYISLRNGYGKDRPEFVVMVTLKIGTGYPAWGAEEDEWYYVLEIHVCLFYEGSLPIKPHYNARTNWYECGACRHSMTSGMHCRSELIPAFKVGFCAKCGKGVLWE